MKELLMAKKASGHYTPSMLTALRVVSIEKKSMQIILKKKINNREYKVKVTNE